MTEKLILQLEEMNALKTINSNVIIWGARDLLYFKGQGPLTKAEVSGSTVLKATGTWFAN